jgi:hypothetical protein
MSEPNEQQDYEPPVVDDVEEGHPSSVTAIQQQTPSNN